MSFDEKVINSLKSLSIDMINNAGSGHPGIALGAAPIIYTLYSRHLNISLKDNKWMNRDRFILSGGHGSALLYSMLYYVGYLGIENLKKFRICNSLTPGHPEVNLTPGVDMTTGPLGQGIASSVGIAIAEKYFENTLSDNAIDYYTYVMCGDGDLMEGISYEAMSLAGTLALNKLIVLYDSNDISLDGKTSLTFNENIKSRVESMNWNYIKVDKGNNIDEIDKAIILAKTFTNAPTLIEVKTIIGEGSLNAGTNLVHGSPLKGEDIAQLKEKLGLKNIPFNVDNKLVDEFQSKINDRCIEKYNNWVNKNFNIKEKLNTKIDLNTIVEPFYDDMSLELRETNSKIMNVISDKLYSFIGGSADLSSSTKTNMFGKGTFKRDDYKGKNIYYGVREHAMGGISNGLALSGLMPYASTFLVFSDYIKPSIRLSALMDLPVVYVFTHDSITIGSDGATHQPVEQLTMLRSIPNFRVFRPCDANEVVGSWNEILNNPKPTALIISKSEMPLLKNSSRENVSKGAYIIRREKGRLDGVIIATGSEVSIAIKIADELEKERINLRVVSMVSMSTYEEQSIEYKQTLLPAGYKKIALEYGSSYSWYKYVFSDKYLINVNTFGKSGSKEDVLKSFNLDYESIKKYIKSVIK